MAKGYTTEVKVENYILNDIDASFSTQITKWIEGVEKYIDQYTGRNFIADSVASARVYDGDGTQELLIDDCVAITKVEVGEDDYGGTFTEIASTGEDKYFTLPANATAHGVPVYSLLLRARVWPCGMQNNRITAKWGYSAAVPEDIEFVATVLVAGIINQHRGGGDKVASERIGNFTVSYNTDDGDSLSDFKRAMQILDSYRKIQI